MLSPPELDNAFSIPYLQTYKQAVWQLRFDLLIFPRQLLFPVVPSDVGIARYIILNVNTSYPILLKIITICCRTSDTSPNKDYVEESCDIEFILDRIVFHVCELFTL